MKTAMEMLDRMEALVRRLADTPFCNAHSEQSEARAIVAELPAPVEPDLIEARHVLCKTYGRTHYTDGQIMAGEGPERVYLISQGKGDDYWETLVALAAIKRGRELEREGK